MSELLPIVVPLLLVDMLNPVLLAASIYAVGTSRPYANSYALLVGHTLAYFAAGIVIALGLERITTFLESPGTLVFTLQIVLGIGLIWAGISARGGGATESKRPLSALTPASAFVFGVVINFVGVPFALPYFAALDQLVKADVSVRAGLALLFVYNLIYVLPFLAVPIAAAIFGERGRLILERINAWVGRAADWLMPKVLAIVGLVLVADGLWYFKSGAGLFYPSHSSGV